MVFLVAKVGGDFEGKVQGWYELWKKKGVVWWGALLGGRFAHM